MVIQGIIRPPPEIRAVADRTALFVSKNGRAFEQRILNSDKGKTPKFAFLHDTSPFNAYYEDRIRFYEEGGDEEDKKEDGESKSVTVKEEETTTDDKSKDKEALKDKETKNTISEKRKASAVDIVARTILAQRSLITTASESSPQPPPSTDTPTNPTEPTANDTPNFVKPPLSLLSVTIPAPSRASPVAIEIMKLSAQMTALNGEFLRELTAIEYHNPMFAFTQPRHGHFAYFTALVDCYKKLLLLGEEKEEEDESLVGSLMTHKTSNDIMTCLEHAAYRSEYTRYTTEKKDSESTSANIATAAATIDWHDFVVVETITFPKDEIVAVPPPVLCPPAVDSSTPLIPTDTSITIVPDFQPRITSTQSTLTDPSRTHVLDPITNQSIPLSDMSEHLRIQLLDPKWAKEKEVFQKKQSESNYVTGGDIARNLGWFVDKKKGEAGIEREGGLEEANRVLRDVGVPTKQEVMMQESLKRSAVDPMPPPPPPPLPSGIPPGMPPTDDDVDGHIDKKARLVLPPPPPPPPGSMVPPNLPPPPPPPPPFIDGTSTSVTAAASAPIHNTDASQSGGLQPPPPAAPPRPSTDFLSEEDYTSQLSSPHATLSITLPTSSSDYASLDGRTLTIPATVQSTIKSIKNLLFKELKDMPVNKMQLKDEERGFLKDGMTLGKLNLGGDGRVVGLELVPKVRGRRNR